MRLLVFSLADQRYAIHLEAVERVLRAVEITRLSDAPRHVLGVINVYGEIIPVLDFRHRLGLPEKEPDLDDQFIIARSGGRPVALLVEGVSGVAECDAAQETAAEAVLPGLGETEGIVRLADGMAIIEDLDRLCSPTVAQFADAPAE
ncbi:MAG: cheW2 [Rhodocyclaceae bacterium]|nr:cheW2 [Rhodocyclaceae bacterium]